jgi:class 3 adenylate cyclase
MELLNVFLDAVTTTVHQAGGIIDKYMGSEVMALFNTQLNPQRDHAQRAVETALILRSLLLDLYAQQGVAEPRWRMGIHSGIATLGNVGGLQRRSFTALGDSINLAKRLQENAQVGQIILSEDTMQQASSVSARFVELPPLQVKGRQQLTRIYEAAVS